jgi:hypothetical protein
MEVNKEAEEVEVDYADGSHRARESIKRRTPFFALPLPPLASEQESNLRPDSRYNPMAGGWLNVY